MYISENNHSIDLFEEDWNRKDVFVLELKPIAALLSSLGIVLANFHKCKVRVLSIWKLTIEAP